MKFCGDELAALGAHHRDERVGIIDDCGELTPASAQRALLGQTNPSPSDERTSLCSLTFVIDRTALP